jgi:hypothetical protein
MMFKSSRKKVLRNEIRFMRWSLGVSLVLAGFFVPGSANAQSEAVADEQPAPESDPAVENPSADTAAAAPGADTAVAAPGADTAVAAPAPAVDEPATDVADLEGLGFETETSGLDNAEMPLTLYGFADIAYYVPLFDRKQFLGSQLPAYQAFTMGKFNVYMAKQMSDRIRALAEVRLTFSPNGAVDPANPGKRISTATPDPSDVQRPQNWSGIIVERVHAEYDVASYLTLRAGQFLTPYGIWNVDHGTPTLIPIRRPYIIGEALFPERQVGVEAFGRLYHEDYRLEYHLTLSNGRGPTEQIGDLDTHKAVGGRMELQWRRSFEIRLGGSFYLGRATDRAVPTLDLATFKSSAPLVSSYNELSSGLDLQIDVNAFVLRAELLQSSRTYRSNGRPLTEDKTDFLPDNRRWGYYALVGYRLPFWGIMPFFMFQEYTFPETQGYEYLGGIQSFQGGLNIQIDPTLILKIEYDYADLPGSPSFIDDNPYQGMEIQLSWVF